MKVLPWGPIFHFENMGSVCLEPNDIRYSTWHDMTRQKRGFFQFLMTQITPQKSQKQKQT